MSDERATGAIDVRIGQRIRTRRLEIGMSQERLAELLGVTFQQIQKYERAKNRVAASRLYEISKALGVSPAYFYPDDSSQAKDPLRFSEQLAMTERGVSVAKKFMALPLAAQAAFYSMLDAFTLATEPPPKKGRKP